MATNVPYLYLLLAIITTYVIWTIFYNLLFSPLRRVPGPFIAKLTGNWLLIIDLAGNRTSTIHGLHQTYGPNVQIGPSELSFSSMDCVQEIYGQSSDYMKAPMYNFIARRGMFNMRDKAAHKQRRKLLSHAFSQSNVNDMEPLIGDQVRKLLAAIEKHSEEPLDVYHWFRMLALDVAGDAFLGKAFGALDSDKTPSYVHDLDNAFLVWAIQGLFPLTYKVLSRIPNHDLQHFLKTDERVYTYGTNAFHNYVQRYGRTSQRKDLLTKLIEGKASDQIAPLSDDEISVETSNLVFAATDSTGITLTYLFWELARHPHLQDRAREELQNVHMLAGVASYRDVANLTLLDAIVHETLRAYPAAPGSLPRMAPTGGKMLGGIFVPEGTVVSVQCYTTQRDPKVFLNPASFDPDRWITTNGGTDEMEELYMPFTKGTRVCMGQNMAVMEMKIATATLLMQYAVNLAPEMTDGDMDITDHFALVPKGRKCLLTFSKVPEKDL